MSTSNEPPKLVRRWESLSTAVQAAIVFPLLAVVFFLLNLVGFNQPVWRSILYGVIESAPFTALVLVATANERRKRSDRRSDGRSDGRNSGGGRQRISGVDS